MSLSKFLFSLIILMTFSSNGLFAQYQKVRQEKGRDRAWYEKAHKKDSAKLANRVPFIEGGLIYRIMAIHPEESITGYYLGGKRTSSFGFTLAAGRENKKSRLWYCGEAEIVSTGKYNYKQRAFVPVGPSTWADSSAYIRGTIGLTAAIRMKLGFYLLKPDFTKGKLLPYITVASGFAVESSATNEFTIDPPEADLGLTVLRKLMPGTLEMTTGAGVVCRISDKLSIRLEGNYRSYPLLKYKDSYFYTMTDNISTHLTARIKLNKK